MDETVFKEYMQRRGYRIKDAWATGVEKEFLITASVVSGKQWKFELACVSFSWKRIDRELRRELKGIAQARFTKEAPVKKALEVKVTVKVSVHDDTYSQNFDQAIRIVLGALKRNNVQPIKTCILCGKGHCDATVMDGGLFWPIHNACCYSCIGNALKGNEDNRLNGSYLFGIIGAILGAVVGSIPFILTIYYLDKIYALLFFLSPLCISIGYKLFHGKRGVAAIVIALLLSFADVCAIEMAVLFIKLVNEYGIPFLDALPLGMQTLQDAHIRSILTKGFLNSIVYVMFGMMLSYKYIANLYIVKASQALSLLKTEAPYNENQARSYDEPSQEAQEGASEASETGTTNHM